MVKKNKTENKPVYTDFDNEVIPNEFVSEGYRLIRNKDGQFLEDDAGLKTAIKCPYTKKWHNCGFRCVDCVYYDTFLTTESPKKEAVNHPLHYGGDTSYECIKVLKAWVPDEEYKGFLRCNAIKYLCRTGKKDETVQELKKAVWYINKLIESFEEKK